MSCYYKRILCFVLLDTGATASAISDKKAKELGLKIIPTKHKLVQIDESYLDVIGEVHLNFYRDDLEFKFSALVVKKMGFDIIGGTGFHKDNDIYSRLSKNKIIVKGVHSFNSTPYLATLNLTKVKSKEKEVEDSLILIKCIRSETILPNESQKIPIKRRNITEDSIVEVEPRREGPVNFPKHHFQKIKSNHIKVTNESDETIKIKKNTPLCQIRATVEVEDITEDEDEDTVVKPFKAGPPEVSKIQFDPGNQFSTKAKEELRIIIEKNKEILKEDLPGYNNHYGKVEASFEWATKTRPQPTKARQPDYNKKGTKLHNDKCQELLAKGVFKKAGDLSIQPRLKNNSFLVKKQSAVNKKWDECSTKDVRLVTSFQVLQKYILNIPAKNVNKEKIHQRCANFKYLAEFDFTNMFYQIKMKKRELKDKEKLAYLTVQSEIGTLVYVRGPQGLPGMSECQEELTDIVLGDMIVEGKAIKFADNVYVGGRTEPEFIENFEEVCRRLKLSNLRVGPSKMVIGLVSTTILGWEWNRGVLSPSAHKINPLTVCELPKTAKGLRSFLGAIRIHKKCLRGLDNISQPLDEACPATISSNHQIEWTEDMKKAFVKCQEILKRPESIVVPRTSDTLVQVGDGCMKLPAVGTVLLVIREGEKAPLPAGYFGFRLKQNVAKWSPCEIEAYTHAKGLDENGIYFRESDNEGIILSDNQNCVDCSKMLRKGAYSTSARLQTFIISTQKYNVEWKHISGKLPTPLIEAADFSSRNPVECNNPDCKVCNLSELADTSFSTLGAVTHQDISSIPMARSRRAWKEIQTSCKTLRRVVTQLQGGTLPRKKERKINDVRLLLRKASLSKDGILIVKSTLPFDKKPTELVVIPREFSESILSLIHYKEYDHPNAPQVTEIAKRKYFFFMLLKLLNQFEMTANFL